jgi:negative regulator of sigma E activity
VDADAIDELRPLPRDFARLPTSLKRLPWYQLIAAVAAAAAAAPTASVNFLVQASSTPSATA